MAPLPAFLKEVKGLNNLQESILDAMKVFVKDSTAKLNFPLTLECEIVKCTDENKGEYEVNYLDNHFLAYCQYKGYKYNVGEIVYVLVPKGDFSKIKIILGVEREGVIEPSEDFIKDVKVDGTSVVTDSVANIDNMATKGDITMLQENFQDGVDAIYGACVTKGSTPESHALSDVVQGILDIETKGTLIEKNITQNGTYNAQDDNADGYSKIYVDCPGEDWYGEVEPQIEDLNPIPDGESRKILTVYYHLAEDTRPRFYSTLNFTINNISSIATLYIYYTWDNNQSASISQQYTDNGNKILTVDYLLPLLNAGDHEFNMTLTIQGGNIS